MIHVLSFQNLMSIYLLQLQINKHWKTCILAIIQWQIQNGYTQNHNKFRNQKEFPSHTPIRKKGQRWKKWTNVTQ